MKTVKLDSLNVGQKAVIQKTDGPVDLCRRLLEMGFLEGSEVEVMHVAPISHDPMAVKVRGTLIALRRQEAKWIEVTAVEAKL